MCWCIWKLSIESFPMACPELCPVHYSRLSVSLMKSIIHWRAAGFSLSAQLCVQKSHVCKAHCMPHWQMPTKHERWLSLLKPLRNEIICWGSLKGLISKCNYFRIVIMLIEFQGIGPQILSNLRMKGSLCRGQTDRNHLTWCDSMRCIWEGYQSLATVLTGFGPDGAFISSCVKTANTEKKVTDRTTEVEKRTTDKTHFLTILYKTSLDYKDITLGRQKCKQFFPPK